MFQRLAPGAPTATAVTQAAAATNWLLPVPARPASPEHTVGPVSLSVTSCACTSGFTGTHCRTSRSVTSGFPEHTVGTVSLSFPVLLEHTVGSVTLSLLVLPEHTVGSISLSLPVLPEHIVGSVSLSVTSCTCTSGFTGTQSDQYVCHFLFSRTHCQDSKSVISGFTGTYCRISNSVTSGFTGTHCRISKSVTSDVTGTHCWIGKSFCHFLYLHFRLYRNTLSDQ